MSESRPRIGLIGTGYVARHFALELSRRPEYRPGPVLTRRRLDRCGDFPVTDGLTDSADALIDNSDLIFECSGDPDHAATVIGQALQAGRPVLTLNAEFHVTVGSHFVGPGFSGTGLLTEAEGDQPGCLAALGEEARMIGLTPLAYVNMKAFLNRNPSREEMTYWSGKQGYSLPMVTAFTDGTKVQIEQCLVANGTGAGIAREDMLGLEIADAARAARELGPRAEACGFPISDYILDLKLPHGVFVVGTHDERQKQVLANCKLGEGPYYALIRHACLVHLDVFKTIARVLRGDGPLLTNSATPRIGVAAVAKRAIRPGERVAQGYGSFDLRGICVNIADRPGHVPVCLARDLHFRRAVEPGQVVTFDDVDIGESAALNLWRGIESRVLAARQAVA